VTGDGGGFPDQAVERGITLDPDWLLMLHE